MTAPRPSLPAAEPRSAVDWLALAWSSGLGSGYFPVASGTFGTLVAMPFAWLMSFLAPLPWALVMAGFLAVTVATAHRAGRLHGVVDAGTIVADEFAGLFVTMAFLPFNWRSAVAGFFLFRIADIVKPWPASWFDRQVKNGLGVTMDDVVAAVYARIAMEALARLGLLG